ncbi:hypothetical protein VWZ82_13060 [Phaeobacter sp. JH20_41]|uniref:hypothetical protein n=1 Tax=Phaeobacter sp. JH20_41 TaxID=3112498 RepID=UPI003A87E9D7
MDVDFLFQLIAANQGGGAGLVGSFDVVVTGGPPLNWDFANSFPSPQVGDVLIGVGASDSTNIGAVAYNVGTLVATKHDTISSTSPGHAFISAVWDGVNTRITSQGSVSSGIAFYVGWSFGLFRGGDGLAIRSPGASSGASGLPNPPTLTGCTPGSLIVACGALDDDAITDAGAPPGYELVTQRSGGVATSMMAWKIAESVTEDPGAFTSGQGTDDWRATTLEIPLA